MSSEVWTLLPAQPASGGGNTGIILTGDLVPSRPSAVSTLLVSSVQFSEVLSPVYDAVIIKVLEYDN